jgi:hypothetical protein
MGTYVSMGMVDGQFVVQADDGTGVVTTSLPLATAAQKINADGLRAKAAQALATNADFLALASPTNAQTLAQVKTLTRECNAVIRLLLGHLDTTDGT